jgi:hypothetical protein
MAGHTSSIIYGNPGTVSVAEADLPQQKAIVAVNFITHAYRIDRVDGTVAYKCKNCTC